MDYEGAWKVTGFRGRPVPTVHIPANAGKDRLAVIFPGLHYGGQAPLLFYPPQLFVNNGYDVLIVDYQYSGDIRFRELPMEGRARWISADAGHTFEAGDDVERSIENLRYVMVRLGKSFGPKCYGKN